MSNKSKKVSELWGDIQDIIGDKSRWPPYIKALFWKRNVNHFERRILAALIFYNGLNPSVFFEWADLIGLCRDAAAVCEFQSLFKVFKEGKSYNMYAYVIVTGRNEYYDSSVKAYMKNPYGWMKEEDE